MTYLPSTVILTTTPHYTTQILFVYFYFIATELEWNFHRICTIVERIFAIVNFVIASIGVSIFWFGDTSSTRAAQYLLYSHFLCTQKNIHISCKPHDTTVFGPLRRTTPPWTRQQGVVASQFCPSYPSFSRTRSRFLLPSRPHWSTSSFCNSIFALTGKTLPDYRRRVPYLCPFLLHSTGPELQNTQFV